MQVKKVNQLEILPIIKLKTENQEKENGIQRSLQDSLLAAPPEAPLVNFPEQGLHVQSGDFGDAPEGSCSVYKY